MKKVDNYNLLNHQFQFIVDFCESKEFNNKILSFKNLTIEDRVLLSVYMTGLINQNYTSKDSEDKKINQMCNIIFDFNGRRKNDIFNMEMTKDFKEMVKKFLEQKKDYCLFVEQDSITRYNNNNDLFRISLNATEYNITRKIKYKRVDYLLYTIYILGTAKNHTSCAILNKFDVRNFSPSIKVGMKMCDKIFNLMKWQYIPVKKGYITWKSKWKMKLNNNDLSEEEQIEKKIAELIKDE